LVEPEFGMTLLTVGGGEGGGGVTGAEGDGGGIAGGE
jgi:hypothetical protein